jgi:hypothetical protein
MKSAGACTGLLTTHASLVVGKETAPARVAISSPQLMITPCKIRFISFLLS